MKLRWIPLKLLIRSGSRAPKEWFHAQSRWWKLLFCFISMRAHSSEASCFPVLDIRSRHKTCMHKTERFTALTECTRLGEILLIKMQHLWEVCVCCEKDFREPFIRLDLRQSLSVLLFVLQDDSREKVTFLFGTQTGTAERFAKELRSELQQRFGDGTRYNVIDIEDYSHEDLLADEKLVFFMLATYGDGEPTDNAANFFSWVTDAAKAAKEDESQKILQVCLIARRYLHEGVQKLEKERSNL